MHHSLIRYTLRKLYHIRSDCFNPYIDLCNFTEYKPRSLFVRTGFNHSRSFMKISESREPYKCVATTSIKPSFRFLLMNCNVRIWGQFFLVDFGLNLTFCQNRTFNIPSKNDSEIHAKGKLVIRDHVAEALGQNRLNKSFMKLIP